MEKCSLVVIKQMLAVLISQATAKSSSIYYIFLFIFFFAIQFTVDAVLF